ncbi:Uu.00g099320.m01.CDS01 [Anthostomella pinea]|uniref:Uu.00g099320.m01.CDS01 n=1 Tax=Anthostomella pinea TaxID=933095 RepID=A0AAI8V7P9_9PEZI|nr:Uu.00g099320.m01.CDS01 [Anthostomella pinea]
MKSETKRLRPYIDAVCRYIDTPAIWPQFARLPSEIRCVVWNLATPGRIVNIHRKLLAPDHGHAYEFEPASAPPITARINRESGDAACRTGKLFPIRNVEKRKFNSVYESLPPRFETQWGWFDPDRDNLRLPIYWKFMGSSGGLFVKALSKLYGATQHVVLRIFNGPNLEPNYWREKLFSPRIFPNLESVKFIASTYQLKGRSDPMLESRLFGCSRDESILVIANDTAATDNLMCKLCKGHASDELDKLEAGLTEAMNREWIRNADEDQSSTRFSLNGHKTTSCML